jgi:hypothetical protein
VTDEDDFMGRFRCPTRSNIGHLGHKMGVEVLVPENTDMSNVVIVQTDMMTEAQEPFVSPTDMPVITEIQTDMFTLKNDHQ